MIHLNTLIPVGIAITIVALVKYARVSKSSPTTNMWCAHTTHPMTAIDKMAYTIPSTPNTSFFPLIYRVACLTIPKAGKIKIYTSGCPKNQNRCSYSTTFPPPVTSKNDVLMFRSSSSIVIAPASTGRDSTNKNVVIIIHQTNKVIWFKAIALLRKFLVVTIKLIEPKIDLTPAKCKLKIARSTLTPLCPIKEDKGGYTVQLVPAPLSVTALNSNKKIALGSNQNLRLFKRGYAMSGANNISGTK